MVRYNLIDKIMNLRYFTINHTNKKGFDAIEQFVKNGYVIVSYSPITTTLAYPTKQTLISIQKLKNLIKNRPTLQKYILELAKDSMIKNKVWVEMLKLKAYAKAELNKEYLSKELQALYNYI